uniref:Uncharacterized protein n=1 Tax=Candidatus Kentrum eta TaxID=2126337 RepID=A0A450VRR8_9GAMM|nr:MAG: hypothetical protein BECKH772B_GA0070898_102242 [Candidatus Kentron sp. H]VFK04436.1 MAG: hypothetical protein BECKH772A_GA0070896_104152 [Candidatus Kentron sp. H]VFK07469.1 MAG: hypothetical protein BECKH772C_GA0070978_104222 [Candidatus Kentron sp. H]
MDKGEKIGSATHSEPDIKTPLRDRARREGPGWAPGPVKPGWGGWISTCHQRISPLPFLFYAKGRFPFFRTPRVPWRSRRNRSRLQDFRLRSWNSMGRIPYSMLRTHYSTREIRYFKAGIPCLSGDTSIEKKYIIQLTDSERCIPDNLINKGKAAVYKIKHANVLLKVDADGPCWSDQQASKAFSCTVVRTVLNIRQRFVEQGFGSGPRTQKILAFRKETNP